MRPVGGCFTIHFVGLGCEVTSRFSEKSRWGKAFQMSIADELVKLKELHDEGALTEEEFEQAKQLVLSGQSSYGDYLEVEGSLARAAHRYVNLQTIVLVIVFIGFALAVYMLFLPWYSRVQEALDFARQGLPHAAPAATATRVPFSGPAPYP